MSTANIIPEKCLSVSYFLLFISNWKKEKKNQNIDIIFNGYVSFKGEKNPKSLFKLESKKFLCKQDKYQSPRKDKSGNEKKYEDASGKEKMKVRERATQDVSLYS